MATITIKGNPVHTSGSLPKAGDMLPNFELINNDLGKVTLDDFKGQRIVLNIFPSLDTGICASSVRNFNKLTAGYSNAKVLCISRDLPFAQKRFCGTEGIENAITLSDFATHQFGKSYGVEMIDGPFAHLLSRAVIVADENGKVIYTEQVPEIAQEPDYDKALAVL